ncbi:exodeoxyribonuclease III [Micropruina sonneratiae]|uniref:exodeoxyribonuclease III n=1 Tax=Micropruina sonneratiae TaxID=2986940 RepID=UPI0022276E9D|nr:exodeoxyribonuclease III [Micropruina sp. KQZ13P-5]MCW3158117.1 exodeoxyribonuclease III [Micropruina sp. KQZ13P-5]
MNGVRAAVRRGFGDWLADRRPDIVALQELRCPVDELPVQAWPEHQWAYHPGLLAGRNGVAVLSRWTPSAVRMGFGSQAFDHEGRYLEIDVEPPDMAPLTVGSLYLPKGGRPEDGPSFAAKQRRKLRFMASFRRYLTTARRTALRQGREFLVMGDFNIAHTTDDLANPGANRRYPGFMPDERDWFGTLLTPRTLTDVVRALHPGVKGPYTWWRWGGQAWDRGTGWRIDYQLASPGLAAAAVAAGTDREASYEARMSDHSPVVVDYAW